MRWLAPYSQRVSCDHTVDDALAVVQTPRQDDHLLS